jgi:LAO/AO transport system kinase
MAGKENTEDIVCNIQKGDKRFASKLMSMVEDGNSEGEECLRILRGIPGQAHVIGVTGWPGVGKSTLISRMAHFFLNMSKHVGIIAVDPTSPLSGGSFLGDRERMRGIDGDERLFIRSMATRGHAGGIAADTNAFVRIMEAMGKDVIIVETVGVGQDQVSVCYVADTVVMTVIPGMGDYLQALKAGIMEVGDIFAVNKADRKGVDEVVTDLRMIIGMSARKNGWNPPIVKTTAVSNAGIDELMIQIENHRNHVTRGGKLLSKRIAAVKLEVVETLKSRLFHLIELEEKLDDYAQQIFEGKIDRFNLVETILKEAEIVKQVRRELHD